MAWLALAGTLAAAPAPPPVSGAGPSAPPATLPDTEPAAAPRVLMVTSLGELLLELDPVAAPRTVANFLAYATEGHYNGTVFHRVVPGLLAQGGGFTPDLQQKPVRDPVPHEGGNGLPHRRGSIAAARDRGVLDSATTQFFINLADNPQFEGRPGGDPYTAGYAVFGRVVQGMEVLDRIAAVPTGAQGPFPAWVPQTPVVIERVQVIGAAPAASPAADAQAGDAGRRP
ncbi:peptidyl-prolyl cis-trans isomerase [Arenimonas fontis]|uniref:Peptidyl-prolyl cis-trans isomerase n=2 Tax=Arenimonas fontis TaxID=2608255 RepID=A0A5B2ZCL3_9GAMM|nr:peptidyl-prolyl cis-trans isomerase [Arenimonas fontis]